MKLFNYQSGDEVRRGDTITYHGEAGIVEFVVTERVGDPAIDWYMDEYEGGVMLKVEGFGNVFLTDCNNEEDLLLTSRRCGGDRSV